MTMAEDVQTVLDHLPINALEARSALMRIVKDVMPQEDSYGYAKEVVRAFYLNGKKSNRWKGNRSAAARELTEELNGTEKSPGILKLLDVASDADKLENHHETQGYSRTVYDWMTEFDKEEAKRTAR